MSKGVLMMLLVATVILLCLPLVLPPLPSLRPCGDDAPALLPGSLPVSPLCILFFGLHSVTTMSDGQVLITPLSLYAQYIHMLFPRLYRLVYIYDMYHTTYRWPSGELLFYLSSPDDAPSWSEG